MATETAPVQQPAAKPDVRPPSARNKSAVLAEMEAADETPAEKSEKRPSPVEAKTEVEPEKSAGSAPKDDEDTEGKTDDVDDKGLERIKAAEKRMRLDVAKDREAFERERTTWKSEVKDLETKVAAIERLGARAKYDPVALLRAFGVPDEEFADVSRMIYAHSPDFAKDPKNKEAAGRLAKEKEDRDRVRTLEEKHSKLEAELTAEREQAKIDRQIAGYLDNVVRAVTDETPLVHRLVAKAPTTARADLQQIAEIMSQEGGDLSEKSVVAMLERVMRDEADELGYEATPKEPAKPAKPATEPEKKPAAPTNGKAARTDPRAARSDLVRKLEADDLT